MREKKFKYQKGRKETKSKFNRKYAKFYCMSKILKHF